MTLDEMLDLLPDNTSGEISAADMRTIVTDLFEKANTYAQTFSYQWSTAATPGSGHVQTDTSWDNLATQVLIHETTSDGYTLVFNLLDASEGGQVWLSAATGGTWKATITGQSIDSGSYRRIPITVDSVVGPIPLNNEKVTVTVLALIV